MQNNTSVILLNTSLIVPNKYQPRKNFDEIQLNTLAESIKTYGIINPILVRKKDDKYEIIAGERRFRAAKKIGLTEVPVIIKNADEQQMAELALIENIARQGLSPIEEAKSYEEIMRIGNQTQASLAHKLGKSQSAIANKIRLLSLPQEIQDALLNKKISERHARSLIAVQNKEKQLELLNRIITQKLTVKETEQIINENKNEEEEIQKAISDIMESLKTKEEEKEDDNMNNGNFFPNFDNNNMMNNNTSLNMMNMQSMNQQPLAAAPEVVMPTTAPIQEQVQPQVQMMAPPIQPIEPPIMEQPIINTPMFNQFEQSAPIAPNLDINNNINPMMNFEQPQNNPIIEPMNNIEPPMINDAPLFSVQPSPVDQPQVEMITPSIQPIEPPVMEQPVIEQPTSPMFDIPLFNPNVTMPTQEPIMAPVQEAINEITQEPQSTPVIENVNIDVTPTTFEIPVNNPVVPEIKEENYTNSEVQVTTDKYEELKKLLTDNGYTFKSYSNETENCIIIELPKN